jgi:hypothetical protein
VEFTFFVDAETYAMTGGELAATEDDLFDRGVTKVDVPREYPHDLGDRVPVRVTGTPDGIRFYARLLHITDRMQLDELARMATTAELSGDFS